MLACWEAVSRPKQALNDLHHHGDSTNDRVAGAEVTNDHDLRTGAGRSCTSRRVRSLFAVVEGTESAGGFAIPITIDPSIILSGSGALEPVRDVARVITVATRDCVVIGAWAGRLGEGVAVHQPDAGDLGQQGCVYGCESPSVGDRADAGALGGGVLAHLAGSAKSPPKSWYDAGDQLLGQTHPHVDVERLGDQGLHVVRDADAVARRTISSSSVPSVTV